MRAPSQNTASVTLAQMRHRRACCEPISQRSNRGRECRGGWVRPRSSGARARGCPAPPEGRADAWLCRAAAKCPGEVTSLLWASFGNGSQVCRPVPGTGLQQGQDGSPQQAGLLGGWDTLLPSLGLSAGSQQANPLADGVLLPAPCLGPPGGHRTVRRPGPHMPAPSSFAWSLITRSPNTSSGCQRTVAPLSSGRWSTTPSRLLRLQMDRTLHILCFSGTHTLIMKLHFSVRLSKRLTATNNKTE